MQRVDIILPIYNPDEKLYQAIDSVLEQTYTYWQLYIVDDASDTNKIEELKDKYKIYSNKISYYKFTENKRAAACRNFAISQGNGEYIAFIDQDDVWLPNKLELQVKYLNNHKVNAVHGNVKFMDNHGNIIMHKDWEKENNIRRAIDWLNISAEKRIENLFLLPNIRIISSMISRDAFNRINGFKEQFFGGEDELFWFEMAINGRIGFINDMLFLRRENRNNTVYKHQYERTKGYKNALKYIKAHYNNKISFKIYKEKYQELLYNYFRLSLKRKKIVSLITLLELCIFCPKYTFKRLSKTFQKIVNAKR